MAVNYIPTYKKWPTISLTALLTAIITILASRGVPTGYVSQAQYDALAASAHASAEQVLILQAKLDALTTPATRPMVDPATFAIDWSTVNRGPIGRVCIYGVGTCDPTIADSVVAHVLASMTYVKQLGGDTVIIWDATGGPAHPYRGNTAYSSDLRLSAIPPTVWPQIAALATGMKMHWGVTISAGRPEGGWYASDDEAVAAWSDLVAYHQATYGCDRYYLDANNGQKPLMVRQVAARFNVLIIAENWDNAGNSVDLGRAAWLWDAGGMGRTNSQGYYWFDLPPGFNGRLLPYLNAWQNMTATEKPKGIAYLRAHPSNWQPIIDAWYGAPAIYFELKGP